MCAKDSITKFTGCFRQQIAEISGLTCSGTSDKQLYLYRKVLLVALLDCLASIRFNKKTYPELTKQNRLRFTRFVDEYGGWPAGCRVSTPLLVRRLKKKQLTGPLLSKAESHLDQFNPQAGSGESLEEMDFSLEELRHLAQREAEERVLEDAQHWSLLYRYRNYLVHEFREPGYGMEVFAKNNNGVPWYHCYLGDQNYYLVYPVALFENIAKSAISGLASYFEQQELDPYDYVDDASDW